MLEKEKEGGREALRCSLGIFGFEMLFVVTLQASQNRCYLPLNPLTAWDVRSKI